MCVNSEHHGSIQNRDIVGGYCFVQVTHLKTIQVHRVRIKVHRKNVLELRVKVTLKST